MATTGGTAVLAEINNRLTALEAGMSGASNVASRVAHIEIQIAAGSSAISKMAFKIQQMEVHAGSIIDAKLAAAVATLTASGGMQSPPENLNWNPRSILESKAVQESTLSWTRRATGSGVER